MRVQALWNYPVKSLLGHPQERLAVENRGIVGDRLFAVTDPAGKLGSGKTTRRFKRIDGLLALRAEAEADRGRVLFPDGRTLALDSEELADELSAFLGEPVTLRREEDTPHHDDSPVHLLLSSELAALQARVPEAWIDPRRFRANIILDTPSAMTANDLVDRTLTLGSSRLLVTHKTERCRMVTMEQEDLPFDPRILKAIAQAFDVQFGVYAKVLKPGTVSLGDPVEMSAGRQAPADRLSKDLGI